MNEQPDLRGLDIERRPFKAFGRKNDSTYRKCLQRRCDHCRKPLLPDGAREVPAVFTTEQTSCMRGDDIVKIYHVDCFAKIHG